MTTQEAYAILNRLTPDQREDVIRAVSIVKPYIHEPMNGECVHEFHVAENHDAQETGTIRIIFDSWARELCFGDGPAGPKLDFAIRRMGFPVDIRIHRAAQGGS